MARNITLLHHVLLQSLDESNYAFRIPDTCAPSSNSCEKIIVSLYLPRKGQYGSSEIILSFFRNQQ